MVFGNFTAFSQQVLVTAANKRKLTDLSIQLNKKHQDDRQEALALAKKYGWPVYRKTKNGGLIILQGVSSRGFPIYMATSDNIIAAATTQTNTVQPGGSQGLNLSGSSSGLNNKIAMWDGGSVYTSHQEFAGKLITNQDTNQVILHATHVAGTMMAKGVNPVAKGMAFNASTLHSYYFGNDLSEMSAVAANLVISNHSYGYVAGWYFDDTNNRWDWYGIPGDTVDNNFGVYGLQTQVYDNIAYNAPYYLIVEAAGNNHGSLGPPVGSDYYGFKNDTDFTFVDKGPRPANISSNDGYEVISITGNAKNILTVGAIKPLPNGPADSQDITIADFSSWGPTDDGRIKPDIVGDGVNVLSTDIASPTSYATLSGTSMATPNVTGSLYLLQEHYAQHHSGNFMRAATLKGLACHTAFDAGNPGPDYIYGWGLLDMKKASQALIDNGIKSLVKENTLSQGQTQTFTVTSSGYAQLAATISQTDPAGTPTQYGSKEGTGPNLVNDLDIRVNDGVNTYYPWVLDPSNPAAPATTGDNVLDNIEQVLIPNAGFSKTYTITVTHKGTLQYGPQDYSLIVTGLTNVSYCASAPLSNADSRIDNVTLSNVNNTPGPGCTSYSNYTNLVVQLIRGQAYPLSITLGTCAANFNKAAKVYIDWNNNGVFEANELVATTNIINGTGTYTTNITVPNTIIFGAATLMRVVLTETSDVSLIQPCGSYGKGETQDYPVYFTPPQINAQIVGGNITACAGSASQNPNVVQIQVSGNVLNQNITATATTGFEISFSPVIGFGKSLIIPLSGNSVINTNVYVRSSGSAPVGTISGTVSFSSSGINWSVPIVGKVNSFPIVNPIQNQGPYLNGGTTNPIIFTGTGNGYTWVNDTPSIGLPASGSGDIGPFQVVNNTGQTIKATITAVPVLTGYAYIANRFSGSISVINTATNVVVATIPINGNPWGLVVSPDGSRVYVISDDGLISVINSATNQIIKTGTTLTGSGLYGTIIAVSPDGNFLYGGGVNNQSGPSLRVFDSKTLNAVADINLNGIPANLVFSPDGKMLYVAQLSTSGNIAVINTGTNTVVASIPVENCSAIAVNPNGSQLYAVNYASGNMAVINTVSNSIIETVAADAASRGIAVSPDGSKIYFASEASQYSSVIETTDFKTVAIITANDPYGVALSPDGNEVYFTNWVSNSVSVFNTSNDALITNVSVGDFPSSLSNFVTGGSNCGGAPITFSITVNPTTNIVAGLVTGSISACTGSASVSPNIQQFTTSGINLNDNLIVTAPSGFEVSTSIGNGYSDALTLNQSGGVVSNTVIYVRSSTSAAVGNISGNVVLTSTGTTTVNVAVSGIITGLVTPVISIAASGSNICAGATVTFTATPVNAGSAPVYQWLLNGTNTRTSSTTFSSNTLANGDKISCMLTNNDPCVIPASATSNIVTMIVNQNVAPKISITASINNICDGTPVTFSAVANGGGNSPLYNWLVNGVSTGTNNISFSSNSFANGDKISCMLTNNDPCVIPASVTSNIVTMIVNQNVAPTISINASINNICDGTPVTFSAVPTGGGNSPVYNWLVNGVSTGTNSISFSSNSFANGDKISCMLTNNDPCVIPASATSNIVTMIVNQNVAPTISITASINNICDGTPVTFSAVATGGGNSPVYNWLVNGVSTGTNNISFSSNSFANGNKISCMLTNNDPCVIPASATSNIVTMIVNQNVTPTISITAINNNTCEGTLVTFFANVEGGGNTPVYQWLLNGVSAGTNSSTFSGDTFANGEIVSCTFTNNALCVTANNTSSNQITLLVNPLPVVDAGGSKSISDGSGIQLNATAPGNLKDITWSPATGLSNNKILNPIAAPTATTTYTLTVQTDAGCIATDTMTLTVFINLFIPNTFTPNGDGINDTWNIQYLDAYPNCTVNVYNRYGEMVYSSIGYGVPWDGKYNGANLPQGTYYYIINLGNGSKVLSGSVTIIR